MSQASSPATGSTPSEHSTAASTPAPGAGSTPSAHSSVSTAPTVYSKQSTPSVLQDTATHLESICVGSVLAVNARDLDYTKNDLFKSASSTFKAHFDNFPHPLTMAEHSTILRSMIEQFPKYHVEVKSVSSEVDEETGIATVFMETEVTGAPDDIRTRSMNEYRWRRDRGTWRCWSHVGMKSMSDYN